MLNRRSTQTGPAAATYRGRRYRPHAAVTPTTFRTRHVGRGVLAGAGRGRRQLEYCSAPHPPLELRWASPPHGRCRRLHVFYPDSCCGAFPQASRISKTKNTKFWICPKRVVFGPKHVVLRPPGVRRAPGARNPHLPGRRLKVLGTYCFCCNGILDCPKTCRFVFDMWNCLPLGALRAPCAREATLFAPEATRFEELRSLCVFLPTCLPQEPAQQKQQQSPGSLGEGPAAGLWEEEVEILETAMKWAEARHTSAPRSPPSSSKVAPRSSL